MDRNVKGKDSSGKSIENRQPHRSISKPDQKSLQTAYDFTPIGIVQSSMDGKHIYANAEFCRIVGYEREELLQRGMDDVTHADDFFVERKLNEQLGTGEIQFYKLEKRYVRKDGEIIWVELTRSTVRNSRGKALHTIGAVLDITERKRTEEALTRAREQAEKATDRIARLQQITAALTGVTTTGQMAQGIFEHGIQAAGASAGILVELTDDGREIKTVASRGYPPAAVSPELITLSVGTPLSDCILKKQAVWIRSQQEFAAQYPQLGAFRSSLGIEATAALPLIVENRVLGSLSFSFLEGREFESEEREFFLAVAQQCAQAFDRVLSREMLSESESMLADAQRIARIGSWRWDVPSGRLRWSDGLYAIYGVDRKNFSPTLQSFADYIHPDDRQIVEQKIEQLSSTGAAVDFEFRICSETGETLVLRAVGQVTEYDNHGKPLVIIGANHDITEQKRAEEARRRGEQRYRIVGEVIPFGVWESDLEGNATYLSPLYLEMTGQTLEEHRQSWQTLIHAEETDSLVEAWRECVRNGALWDQEFRVRGKDGNYYAIHARGLPIHNATGEITSYVGINFDVSDHRRVEEALRESERQLQQLNASLEGQVQEKTAEVRKLAAEVTEAVQRERHRLSHILHDDIQQRIYAIQMQLSFLRNGLQKYGEQEQRVALDIETQLLEVLEITRNLSIEMSPPVLRGEGLTEAISWLAHQMLQRFGLPVEIQADEPFAIQDEALHVFLFNCVREMLFNTVKHAGASRAMVALRWIDSCLEIKVQDDGKGFPGGGSREQSEEEPASASLGIPAIRQQLTLFGGTMDIQSAPGTGTRILITVPIPERA